MKKLAVMTISIVLISAMAISGSLAYFTDTVTNTNNVITAGSVQIAQIELQRNTDASGAKVVCNTSADAAQIGPMAGEMDDDLIAYKQNQPLYPAYATNANSYTPSVQFYWGDYVTSSANSANDLWNDANLTGVMDKFVFVENVGTSPAYCRTLIALECPDGVTYGTTADTGVNMNEVDIMLNLNTNGIQWSTLDEKITVDGTTYLVKIATYTDVVKAGATSMPSMLQVVMTGNATNHHTELMRDSYEILVLTQACQTTTFIDAPNVTNENKAIHALNTCFAEVTKGNTEQWFYNMLHPENTAAAQNNTPSQA